MYLMLLQDLKKKREIKKTETEKKKVEKSLYNKEKDLGIERRLG